MELPSASRADLEHRYVEASEDVEIQARVTGDLADGADEKQRHLVSTLMKDAGGDTAIPSVAAPTAQHRHAQWRLVAEACLKGRGHLTPGILHQDDGGYAEVMDGGPVGLAHLRGGQDAH
jgi:hypothetical protein